MSKKICLLGSTGSIGEQTLEVVDQHEDIEVLSICCNSNIDKLEKQVRKYKPSKVCVFDDDSYLQACLKLHDTDVKVLSGMEGINEIVSDDDVDMVVSGISGMIGIEPTISAIKAGKDIALANKETLVCAGEIIMPLAREYGIEIIPVDSEHSAIYQCIDARAKSEIEKIIITASGGPFRGYTKEMLENVTKEQALKHPNWSMGSKITIDSASLINKGLEVIEAKHLFEMNVEDIEVVVHPESIIHSMVQFIDGAIMAQLGASSMKVPIQYAIYRGNRKNLNVDRLDFLKLKSLNFEKPDMETFKGLKLCIEALKIGGTMPAVLNAVNEIAVRKFLDNKIKFLDIADMIEGAMNEHKIVKNPKIEDIINAINYAIERYK